MPETRAAAEPIWTPVIGASQVAMVYHFLPHYRLGVFREFEKAGLHIKYFSGVGASFGGVPTLDPATLPAFESANLLRLGPLIIQPYVCWVALTGDFACYVFFADIHFVTTWIAAWIAKMRNRRVVFWGHGYLRQPPTILSGLLKRAFYSLCDAFFSYSCRGKELWVAQGLFGDRYYIGLNSLDYRSQLPLRAQLLARSAPKVENNEFVVLCVSRLTRAARYDLVIDAVEQIGCRKPDGNIKLVIIGDGECRKELESLARSKGIPALFRGVDYCEDSVSRQIWDADVVVSPGKVGLTAIHALMYGTPVITHGDADRQMPEFEIVIDKFNGSLFERDNSSSLADAIQWWIECKNSRSAIRNNCFALVDRFYNPMYQAAVMKDAISGIRPKSYTSLLEMLNK